MIVKTQTYGKWILCGEQSVLRGYPAIVFPLANFTLNLKYTTNSNALEIISHHPELEAAIKAVWQRACPDLNSGHLQIHSTIPPGQGMGASAALCLAIARCVDQVKHPLPKLWEFAKRLENLFHGQSSGLDILGVGSQHPQWFHKGEWQTIDLQWQPQWCLTPSKEVGKTASAIQHVQHFIQVKPKIARAVDEQMQMAAILAKQALLAQDLEQLAKSMRLAHDCFSTWGLITPQMAKKIQALYQQGALAVKPTGSGGGGFLLSLWKQIPSKLTLDSFKIILPNDNKPHPA